MTFEWRAAPFPTRGRSLLEGADVGVLLAPPHEDGIEELTIAVSAMVVVMAAGHPLARRPQLEVADVVDETFPGTGAEVHPQWQAFWTLDAQRGGRAPQTADLVSEAGEGLDVVSEGRAIGTFPAALVAGLSHPGVVAVPLTDAPPIATKLLWRSGERSPVVRALVDLASAMRGDVRTSAG